MIQSHFPVFIPLLCSVLASPASNMGASRGLSTCLYSPDWRLGCEPCTCLRFPGHTLLDQAQDVDKKRASKVRFPSHMEMYRGN